MMKPGGVWGKCPKRYVGWAQNGQKVGGWGYICSKTGSNCNPEYCLGPDEDEKGDKNERETV